MIFRESQQSCFRRQCSGASTNIFSTTAREQMWCIVTVVGDARCDESSFRSVSRGENQSVRMMTSSFYVQADRAEVATSAASQFMKK